MLAKLFDSRPGGDLIKISAQLPLMNCPFCKQTIPENHTASVCPYCGHELPSINPPSVPEVPQLRIKWVWFWTGLMAPPVLTALSALLMRQTSPGHATNESLSPGIALIGGGIGGILCGIVIGTRLGKTQGARVGLALLFSAIMIFVCIILCFFGCSLGGYQLDMK